MAKKLPEDQRKVTVGVALTAELIKRIDAVSPDNGRSQMIRMWIEAGLRQTEQSIDNTSAAYKLLGGGQ